ncbi:MAG TPA: TetR/AcrR family transcriptional regulator [Aggregatilineales bacterium]|nr:TetR/AcrR family transcriptional regulator [Aggregatilineales bacterium]
MSHPTRDALLEAGLQLAEQHSLASISINDIVTQAKVAKGTFYVHFHDRAAYLVALHQSFHEGIKQKVLSAVQDKEPGFGRLQVGTVIYLDSCLQAKAVKALLLEARSEAPIAAEVQRRNADFAALAHADFEAEGWPHAEANARLFVAMSAEAALIELEIGKASPTLRTALFDFLQ